MEEKEFDNSGLKVMKEFLEEYGWKLDGELYVEPASYNYGDLENDSDYENQWSFHQDISCTLSNGTEIGLNVELGRYNGIRKENILTELQSDLEHCINFAGEDGFFEIYIPDSDGYTLEEVKEGDVRLEELYNEIDNYIREGETYEELYQPCD